VRRPTLAQYAATYAALQEAAHSVAQFEEQQQVANRLLKAGETEQFTVIAAELQTSVAERARLDALHQAQLSVGLLEDALHRPIDSGTIPAFPTKALR
jgi:outer membrane protein TolC